MHYSLFHALGKGNYIQAISAGYGVSGNLHESVRSLKRSGVLSGYTTDNDVRPSIANLLGPYRGGSLAVPYPVLRQQADQSSSPNFQRDRLSAQGFSEAVALQVRSPSPRSLTSKARTGTFPVHNRAMVGATMCSYDEVGKHTAQFDAKAAAAAAVLEKETDAAELEEAVMATLDAGNAGAD